MNIKNNISFRNIWIGLANVKPLTGCDILKNTKGAYVNIICNAENRDIYMKTMTEALDHYKLELIHIEDVELLDKRLETHEVDSKLIGLAKEISETNRGLRFGDFHIWDE